MLWTKWSRLAAFAWLVLALPLAAHAQARFQIRLAEDKDNSDKVEVVAATKLPAYRIGVALRDTDPSLLAHLKLDFGVMVGEVIDGSPAEKAGLKSLDIITHAGDKEIKSGEDLLKAVGEAKDEEMTLTIYREAKKDSIKVTPAKRPEDQVAPQPRAVEAHPREAVERALRLWKDRAGPLELDLLGPGVVVRSEPAPIPDDMKITVEREGPKKAKITVKQGENSWGANEEEIDTLPEVARPHVRMMLGLPADQVFAFRESVKLPKPTAPVAPPRFRPQESRIELEDPLKRIEAELKKLRQEVEDLRKESQDK